MQRLLDIKELSEQSGRPVRQLRTFVQSRKIPFFRLGHRTILFDREKVEKARARFEVKEVAVK